MPKEQKTYASMYISAALYGRAKQLARSRERSFSEYVVKLIERDLREADRRRLDWPTDKP